MQLSTEKTPFWRQSQAIATMDAEFLLGMSAVWFATRDPRSPWFAKTLALAVAAYAVSPIGLISGFISVLDHANDFIVIVLPPGIMRIMRLIPPEVMNEHREIAVKATERPVDRMAAGVFIAIWIVCSALLVRLFL